MPKKKRKVKLSDLGSPYDPSGSYTGVNCGGRYEKPVQDADDL